VSLKVGLVHVKTARLEALLAALHHGKLTAPLTTMSLMAEGFHDLQDQLGALSGLDAVGLRALLVCVLAERRAAG
jgi:hypothetical protein